MGTRHFQILKEKEKEQYYRKRAIEEKSNIRKRAIEEKEQYNIKRALEEKEQYYIKRELLHLNNICKNIFLLSESFFCLRETFENLFIISKKSF